MSNNIQPVSFDYTKNKLLRDVARMAAIESVNFFKEALKYDFQTAIRGCLTNQLR